MLVSMPFSLNMLSSKALVCSDSCDGFPGVSFLGSLSTCKPKVSERSTGKRGTNHDIKVDQFFRNSRHVILKAECVFSDVVRGQNVVALSLLLAVKDGHVPWVLDVKIDIE